MFKKINIFWLSFILIFLNFSAVRAVNTNFVSSPTIGTGASLNFMPLGSINGANYVFGTSKIDSAGSSYFMGGNVGIGTTNPGKLLTLQTSNNNGLYIINTGMDTATGGRFLFNPYSSYGLILQEWNSSDVFQRNVMTFQKETGNVGIGTTAPGKLLEVNGQAKFNNLAYGTTPVNTDLLALSTVEYVNGKTGGSGGVGTGTSGQTLRHNGTGWVANSTLFNDGTNVGIGTTGPTSKLQIATGGGISYAGDYKTYQTGYTVNTATPAVLVDDTGAAFNVSKSYRVKAVVPGTGTETGAVAVFRGNGTVFTLLKNFDAGLSSNNIEFFLNAGVPSVRLYSHATLYSISVLTEEVLNKGWAFGPEVNLYGNPSGSVSVPTGNVGIGTTAPGAKLTVYDTIAPTISIENGGGTSPNPTLTLSRGAGLSGSAFFDAAGKHLVLENDYTGAQVGAGNMFFNTNGANTRMTIAQAGNVGIGTTAPGKLLEVNGQAKFNNLAYGTTPVNTDLLALSTVEYVNGKTGGSGGVGVGTSGQTLRHNGTSWVANSTLFNDGTNVGIGTTGPGAKLIVNGNYSAINTKGIFGVEASDVYSSIYFGVSSSSPYNPWIQAVTRQDMLVKDLLLNPNGGNVGVGTSTPIAKLHVYGNGTLAALFTNGNVGIGTTAPTSNLEVSKLNADISLDVNTNSRPKIISKGWNADLDIHTFQVGGTENNGQLYLQSTGNVGIGTTAPLYKLDLNGTFRQDTLVRHPIGVISGTATAKRYEIARIGYDKVNWSYNSSVFVELFQKYYDASGYKKYEVRAGYSDDGSYRLVEVVGGGPGMANVRLQIGSPVLVSGTVYYLPIYVDANYYTSWETIISHNMGETANNVPLSAELKIFDNPAGSDIASFSETDVVTHDYTNYFSGNVGIGTTAPGKLLEVNGQAKFNNLAYGTTPVNTDLLALSTVEYVNGKTGGSGGVGVGTSGQTLRHNGTSWVANSTLFNDGTNVGIGTTVPAQKLDVAGNINISAGSAYMYNGVNVITALTTSNNYFFGGAGNLTMTGAANTANGSHALLSNTTGGLNVANGWAALESNTTGSRNTANGSYALDSNTTGAGNTANGYLALISNITGSYNTANGYFAGYNGSPALQTMSNSTFLGYGANSSVDGVTNSMALGNGAQVTASNQVVLGNTSVTQTLLNGNVGIGTTNPGGKLDVHGVGGFVVSGTNLDPSGGYSLIPFQSSGKLITGWNYTGGRGEIDLISNRAGGNIGGFKFYDYTNAGAMNSLMTIQGDGNVGIGTTAPGKLLEVNGQAKFNNLAFGTTPVNTDLLALATVEYVNSEAGGGVGTGTSGQTLRHNGTGWVANSTLFNDGTNVGIGTISPVTPLHVAGTSGTNLSAATLENLSTASVVTKTTSLDFRGRDSVNTQKLVAQILSVPTDYNLISASLAFNTRLSDAAPAERMRITSDGNVGIGTTNPLFKLDVNGDIKFSGVLKTTALSLISPIYIRGTGANNPFGACSLIIGSTNVLSACGRGLTLTIINKADHVVVSVVTYDTYGNTVASDNLATALNGMTSSQIGILVSSDAWEATVTTNLKNSFSHLGLFKALVTDTDARRPYAAIFEPASASENSNRAVEVSYQNTTNQPAAELRGWLINGSFDVSGGINNALTSPQGNVLGLIVNPSGNVGIGTTNPGQKLDVAGNININTNGTSALFSTYKPANSDGNNIWIGGGGQSSSSAGGSYQGANNTANGIQSLYANTTGNRNTANGYTALYSNTTGFQNTANGSESLYLNTIGNNNIANGRQSLYSNTSGSSNTANGMQSLYYNTTGSENTANGSNALRANTIGSSNTANGMGALQNNTTGVNNTANGNYSLLFNNTGVNNTAQGTYALFDLNIANGTGNNTALGYSAGRGIVTGINNTILGANVTGLAAALSNNIIIADGSGNQRINVDSTGNVGIGTTAPGEKLEVNGTIKATSFIYNSSDINLKKNIVTIQSPLDKILQLRGVTFDWKKDNTHSMGLIAQEVEKVFPELVAGQEGNKAVAYGNLVAPLIEAIKAQQKEIDTLNIRIKILETASRKK